MGDGGAILQIRDSAGQTVAISNAGWQCLVIHTAPLDRSCESEANPVAGKGACAFEATDEPVGWDTAVFDASAWPQASLFSEAEVSPKEGYDRIAWDDASRLIWGPDLERSNTILCRLTVE